MITLTKTINKLPKNPLLKTNKGEHRLEMNIKTRTGNHQQASPQGPPFLHFWGRGVGVGSAFLRVAFLGVGLKGKPKGKPVESK